MGSAKFVLASMHMVLFFFFSFRAPRLQMLFKIFAGICDSKETELLHHYQSLGHSLALSSCIIIYE